jgi:pilus assembly protein Flp/PilA
MRGGDSGDLILGKHLIRFLNNESGATAIESGLIAGGISVAIIAVVAGLGTSLNTAFGGVRCYFLRYEHPEYKSVRRSAVPSTRAAHASENLGVLAKRIIGKLIARRRTLRRIRNRPIAS